MGSIKSQKSFTLIELLIVIAIIAIIAGAILVAINPAMRLAEAQDSRRWSEVRSVLTAVNTYTVDNRGDIPNCNNLGENIPADGDWRWIGTTGNVKICKIRPECPAKTIGTCTVNSVPNCCCGSLFDWEAIYGGIDFTGCSGGSGDLVCDSNGKIAVAQIEGDWPSPDTTPVYLDGWETNEDYYIKIYTTSEARHEGVWSNTKYRLQASTAVILTADEDARIEGLQVYNQESASGRGIVCAVDPGGCSISHNLVRGVRAATTNGIYSFLSSSIIYNNIVYNVGEGITYLAVGGTHKSVIYNNTVFDSDRGISISACHSDCGGGRSDIYLKNNLVQGGSPDYYFNTTALFDGYTIHDNDANISEDTSANDENIGFQGTVDFLDNLADPPDLHLDLDDTVAIEAGEDLSSDPDGQLDFSDDIDGGKRKASTWDIGADEEDVENGIILEEVCDLSSDLVAMSGYLSSIPQDPTDSNVNNSGYLIKRDPSGTISVRAPYASDYEEQEIKVSR